MIRPSRRRVDQFGRVTLPNGRRWVDLHGLYDDQVLVGEAADGVLIVAGIGRVCALCGEVDLESPARIRSSWVCPECGNRIVSDISHPIQVDK